MDTLPPAMVAELEALGRALVTWAQRHRDPSLVEQEQGVLDQIRPVAPRLLAVVLRAATTSLDARQPHLPETCPHCGTRTRGQGGGGGYSSAAARWPTDRTLGLDRESRQHRRAPNGSRISRPGRRSARRSACSRS